MNENNLEQVNNEVTSIPSMDEFKDDIEKSFKKFREGDLINGTIINITDEEVTIDLESYAEGIIPVSELSNDPAYSLDQLALEEKVDAMIIKVDDGNGNLLLSKKRADEIIAWDVLLDIMDNKTIKEVLISQVVNGGLIAYLQGIRGFIPASQLSMSYVDNLEEWLNKKVQVKVIAVERETNRLVLSRKEVEIEKQIANKNSKIAKLQVATVVKGIVESIMPYGAFVKIDNDLSGLIHISQISHKRIKSVNEVLKEGDEVNVKIIDIKDGKISLSMKEIEAKEDVVENINEIESSYSDNTSTTTSLASILQNLNLK